MAGLVNYGSSDEEDNLNVEISTTLQENANTAPQSIVTNGTESEKQRNGEGTIQTQPTKPNPSTPLIGPVQGPSIPEDTKMSELLVDNEGAALQSPYSANRALLRDLTLPTFPNYDIPPSPPGLPIQSTNKKFKHFLDLKRQGVHFNDKLAKSAALKNPSLMQKLMDFSGIDEAGQYSTTVSKDLWDPEGFPEIAYKEQLAKTQKQILKQKEDQKVGHQRDFVSASGLEVPSRSGTPDTGVRSGQKSAAERVMAGLERGRSNSPLVQGLKRKSRFES